jgi:hypothetical protein
MALRPKTSVLQMRVDPQLLSLFHESCDARNTTASAAIRVFMANEVEAYRIYLVKKGLAAKKAQEAISNAVGAPVPVSAQKSPVVVSGKPEGDVAKRMRLKKEAKLRKLSDDYLDDD